jgi:hypothetical protein
MNANRKLAAVLSALFVVFTLQAAAPNSAHACRCSILTDWNRRVEFYEVIFTGEVTSITSSGEDYPAHHVTFDVSSAWKGVSRPQFAVYADMDSMCGVQFEVGNHWLIWTHGEVGFVNACQLPQRLEDADEALAVLGSPSYVNLDGIKTRLDDFASVVRTSFKEGPVTYSTEAYPQFFLALSLATLILLTAFLLLLRKRLI